MSNKAVVIGLDAATFKLLDPLIQEGVLPNLKKLRAEGSSAVLKSTMPPYTAPAWTTFATGVNPGKHGCYDFLLPTDNLENFDLCNSTHIRTQTIYELLHQASKRSILINLPNSFPPKLNTPIITDMLTVGDNCVFPEVLKEKYPILKKYRLIPDESLQLKGKMSEYIADIITVEQDHMEAVKTLWQHEPWDFFFYLFSATDWVSHAMFDKLMNERATPLGQKAMELYRFIDEQLGWFMDHLPADTNLYIMSDHGFKTFKHTFYFNKWLEQEGYLVTKTADASTFHQNISKQDEQRSNIQKNKRLKLSINKDTLKLIGKNKVIEKFAKWFYHNIAKPFLPVKISLDVVLDFSKTKVCFPKGRTMTAIYINDGRKYKNGITLNDAEYLKLRNEIIAKLKKLTGPDGKPVTTRVYTKEEIYGDNLPDRCPDLFYEFGDYWFVGQFHSSSLFVDEISNKHDPYGIFVAWGPNIKSGNLPEQSIADITPTVLHDLEQPVPTYMDGKVLDIFKNTQPVKTINIPLVKEKKQLEDIVATIKM
ncbi:MAG: alkaline phosphatase family protein [Patescibacteria group bacterium]|jgi:predicted AlkP superfamily phosphohydrolase/phosphomutase